MWAGSVYDALVAYSEVATVWTRPQDRQDVCTAVCECIVPGSAEPLDDSPPASPVPLSQPLPGESEADLLGEAEAAVAEEDERALLADLDLAELLADPMAADTEPADEAGAADEGSNGDSMLPDTGQADEQRDVASI